MPVYVYKNLRTGEKFEVEQRITEPALTEHPESGDPIKRLIQPVGIAFKGSGFYVTDSRSGSSGSSTKSDSTSQGESKVESKSASEGSKTASDSASTVVKSSD
ncbi:MAG TPA: FmdB family transcriptional regulator [Trueperaceae bacterium]